MKATCVLITKEKTYPKEILKSLPDFDEVLIQTECPSVARRYELALKAKNDLIYVQDDDCIVDVPQLKFQYNGLITNFISEGHKAFYTPLGMTLIGWGTLFPKWMIDFDRYLDQYGIDEIFLSQADRIFTYLNQPFNSIVTDIQHLPTATAPGRMHTSPGHWEKLEEVKKRLYNIIIKDTINV